MAAGLAALSTQIFQPTHTNKSIEKSQTKHAKLLPSDTKESAHPQLPLIAPGIVDASMLPDQVRQIDLAQEVFPDATLLTETIETDEAGQAIKRIRIFNLGDKRPMLRIEGPIPHDYYRQSAMVADHLVVKLKENIDAEQWEKEIQNQGLSIRKQEHDVPVYLISFPPETFVEYKEQLLQNTKVAYAEPDYFIHTPTLEGPIQAYTIEAPEHAQPKPANKEPARLSKLSAPSSTPPQVFPNDPYFQECYGLHNTGQGHQQITSPDPSIGTADADIDAPEAWSITTGSRDVVVGVIDGGCRYWHSDLQGNNWTNPNEIPNNNKDDDGNGIKDDYYFVDFTESGINDATGHGTHISGTIGAVGNNGIGVAGVCWQVKIAPLQIFTHTSSTGVASAAAAAIRYATSMGISITNNSWRLLTTEKSHLVRDAIIEAGDKGYLFVTSAGNYAENNDVIPSYPASFDLNNILSVGATDDKGNYVIWRSGETGERSSGSNYGAISVDLAAPGTDIMSLGSSTGTKLYTGTSMASPHVTGTAALIKSIRPDLDALAIKEILMASVDPSPTWSGKSVTGGVLNAHTALLMAKNYGNNDIKRKIGFTATPIVQLENVPAINNQPGTLNNQDWFWWNNLEKKKHTLHFLDTPTMDN